MNRCGSPPRIDFWIVGAPKSGTTSLYDYLQQHPGVWLPAVKENAYFARDDLYGQDTSYLRMVYERAPPHCFVGGNHVHSMYFPYVAARLHCFNPRMRIVAVLRQPVERAYSSYWFARRNGWETLSFEQAIADEPRRASGSYIEQTELTHIAHGHYAAQLSRYFDLFGADRVHVVLSDELQTDPASEVGKVLAFLGADPSAGPIDYTARRNESAVPRWRWISEVINRENAWHKRIGRKLISPRMRHRIERYVTQPLLRSNLRRFVYPPMDPATRQALADLYRIERHALTSLTGHDLERWER